MGGARVGLDPVRPEAHGWVALGRLWTSGWRGALVATLLYTAMACWLLWPMVSDLGGTISGALGDITGTMAYWREIDQQHAIPFLPGTLHDFNAPEGQPIRWVLSLVSFPSTLLIWLLTLATGSIAGLSLYVLLAFIATGASTYLFCRYLGLGFGPALLGGFAFAFAPFAVAKAAGHVDYVHGWPFVLLAWRMLVLAERPTRRSGLWAGAAAVLCLTWTPYYVLLGGVLWATLAAVGVLQAARGRRLRAALGPQLICAGIVLLTAVAMLGASTAGEASGIRTLSMSELYVYSARPYEYVLPLWGPISDWTGSGDFLHRHLHGSNGAESTLYVGLSVLALALVAAMAAWRRRLDARLRRAVLAIGVLGIVAVLFSAPPTWGVDGVNVPFPSKLVFAITETWRAYSRFVIVVCFAFAVLAAIGLERLVRGRALLVQVALVAAAFAIVGFDLWPHTAVFTPIEPPSVYSVLHRQPPGIVAQYPLVAAGESLYDEIFYQQQGGHPVLNGYPAGSAEEARALGLQRLTDPGTASALAALGVRYVVVRNAPTPYGRLDPGYPTKGFRLIYNDWYARLYRVAPRSKASVVTVTDGFEPGAQTDRGLLFWLSHPAGHLELLGACRPCHTTLSLELGAFARPRVAEFRIGRRLLGRVTVPTTGRVVRIPVTFTRRAVVALTVHPGPESASAATGGADTRKLSIYVRQLSLLEPGR